jgi:hypothetical protein
MCGELELHCILIGETFLNRTKTCAESKSRSGFRLYLKHL